MRFRWVKKILGAVFLKHGTLRGNFENPPGGMDALTSAGGPFKSQAGAPTQGEDGQQPSGECDIKHSFSFRKIAEQSDASFFFSF